jgi:hypothetical protein
MLLYPLFFYLAGKTKAKDVNVLVEVQLVPFPVPQQDYSEVFCDYNSSDDPFSYLTLLPTAFRDVGWGNLKIGCVFFKRRKLRRYLGIHVTACCLSERSLGTL